MDGLKSDCRETTSAGAYRPRVVNWVVIGNIIEPVSVLPKINL